MKKEKLKVLMELRACFEGFSGIPQETRLIFRALNTLDHLAVTGMINHASRQLKPGISRSFFGRRIKSNKLYYQLSRFAISVKVDPMESMFGKAVRWMEKRMEKQMLRLDAILGGRIKVYDFEAEEFGDFIWQSLFSKTLPASDYEMIRNSKFASIRPPSDLLHSIGMQRMQSLVPFPLPILNTRRFDVFLSQMPWSTHLTPNTQLVVRYHDAIPVFLPHTISNPRFHQAAHMSGLEVSRRTALFVCTSNSSRDALLKIHPELEKRSVVIPDTVSHEYYEEKATDRYVISSIRTHINPVTEPKFLTSREKEKFYDRHLTSKPPNFLMMVSTLEPRKNHAKLVAAWDYLRNHGMEDLKLVIIGELGWDFEPLLATIAPMQERGEIFHLYKVPSGQLRILYRAARAVVCPSLAEGFDLSGIETMLGGGAVVASDIGVHREVYGNACEYFNPYSTMDLAKALQRVIAPEAAGYRQELVERGLRHSPQYRSESIKPLWSEFFERIRLGEFRRKNPVTIAPGGESSAPRIDSAPLPPESDGIGGVVSSLTGARTGTGNDLGTEMAARGETNGSSGHGA